VRAFMLNSVRSGRPGDLFSTSSRS
jgi:hypothetical protein